MASLEEMHKDYLASWLKTTRCRWPDCECKEAHSIIGTITGLASRVGHEFHVKKHLLAASRYCESGSTDPKGMRNTGARRSQQTTHCRGSDWMAPDSGQR